MRGQRMRHLYLYEDMNMDTRWKRWFEDVDMPSNYRQWIKERSAERICTEPEDVDPDEFEKVLNGGRL